jgi:mono/diheme cytochrome c family protein
MARTALRVQITKHCKRQLSRSGPKSLEEGVVMTTNSKFGKRFGSSQVLIGLTALAALAMLVDASAQNRNSANAAGTINTQVKIQRAPVLAASPDSGMAMYSAYCASCHGANAKGNGRAAAALSGWPTDLTALSVQNGGKFPKAHVAYVLRVAETAPAHGTTDMPVWNEAFRGLDGGHLRAQMASLRVYNLVNYLERLQVTNVASAR